MRFSINRDASLAAILALCLCASSTLATGGSPSPAPGREPEGQGQSPIKAAEQAISMLRSQGKDVKDLEAAVEALRPDWDSIEKKQQELRALAEAFRPRMEDLMRRLQTATGGGQGQGGESPIDGLQRILDMLKGKGKDVAALQSELDGLEPTFDKIKKGHEDLSVKTPPDAAARAVLEKDVQQFQARIQALAQRVQTMAADGGQEGPRRELGR